MRKADYHNPKAGSSPGTARSYSKAGSASRTPQTFVSAPDGLLAHSVLGEAAWPSAHSAERSEPTSCRTVFVRGDVIFPFQDHAGAWLPEALDELSDVDAEAQEGGYEPPTEQAKNHAERILKSLGHRGGGWPAPSVYPTSDREVAIFFRSESRRASVLILCASDGQGACFAFADGRGRRARYEDAGELPDAFAWAQLQKLR